MLAVSADDPEDEHLQRALADAFIQICQAPPLKPEIKYPALDRKTRKELGRYWIDYQVQPPKR